EINKKLLEQESIVRDEETKLENKTTQHHVLNSKIATLREQHNKDIESFNEVQANYYRIGANIARLEQQIKHTKERQEQLTKDLAEVNQNWQETTSHQGADQNQIELLASQRVELEANIADGQEVLEREMQELQEAEQQAQSWQKNWDDFNANNSKILQQLEVEQTQIGHLEQRIVAETQNLEKFKSELASLDFIALNSEIEQINGLLQGLQDNQNKLREEVTNKQQQITSIREGIQKLSGMLDQNRNKLQALNGRKSSLEALQQAALGKNDTVLLDWLKQHNLEQRPRLAEELQVTSGWETAVETVLGVYLEAVCVDGIASVIPEVKNLTRGNLTLLDQDLQVQSNPRLNIATLASKMNSKRSLGSLLSGIYIAEDINEALAMQSKLNHDESIITKSGIWLGAGWLRVAYDDNPKIGILQRERELQELYANIEQVQNDCATEEQELAAQQTSLMTLEEEHQKIQQQLHVLMAEYSDTQSKITAKKTYLQHLEDRALVLKKEIESQDNNLIVLREQLTVSLKNKEEASRQKMTYDLERQALIQSQDQIQQRLVAARDYSQKLQQDVSSFTLRLQLLQTQVDYLNQSLDRANKRLASLKEQQGNLEASLDQAQAPLVDLEKELQSELEQRLAVETDLNLAKQKTVNIEQELRELEKENIESQETNEKIRMFLEKVRMEREGLLVRSTTYGEQVAELDLKLEDLHAALPAEAAVVEWEEKITHLTSRIERLGLINLAAIEEFEKLGERKTYLDAQNQDLINALNTLEEVMHKIDHDTKARFKEAYDGINLKFQELFPKIFHGGKASLEQTADDLLETGVLIMAQPPGKRNSSIHLLSGGEKALTAIALIFSIFHLNPAPFCILDEVDAPLDDINVQRFCSLVKEMAKTIQFIFITHNKLTMEISEQLIGVTMQELGVSRIVSVDVDAAVTLAGAEK
ncbi:MAG: chromosome segregation protein SMC, partial [Gammaproteobacteria bacterium]|nr:chromosome segregation protein SMC [Gammaproteobacteria bacterium]